MSHNKKDHSLPQGVTVRDLRPSWRKQGLPDDPHKLPWQGRALRPGTKRYVTACRRTKQEAISWAIMERHKMMAGILPSEKCLVADHKDRYLLHLEQKGVGDDYYRQAKRILEDLIAAGARNVNDPTFYTVAVETIRGRKAVTKVNGRVRRRTKTKLSNGTLNRYAAQVKAFTKWLYQQGFINRDPMDRLTKLREDRRVKPVFTWQELRALLSDDLRDQEWWLTGAIMSYTGMRAGEAAILKCQDVRISEGVVLVRLPTEEEQIMFPEIGQKTRTERQIRLQPELAEILTDIGLKGRPYVIANDRHRAKPHTWRTDFDQLLKAAGITKRPGLSSHSYRHTFAALLMARTERPRAVQAALGHACVVTTEGYATASSAFTSIVEQWPAGDDFWIRRSA